MLNSYALVSNYHLRKRKQQTKQEADTDQGPPVASQPDCNMAVDDDSILNGFGDKFDAILQQERQGQRQDAAELQLVPVEVPFPPAVGCHALERPLLEQACATTQEFQRKLLDQEFPISISTLKDRLCKAGYKMESDVQDFKSKASHLASGNPIPGRFKFPKPCLSMCINSNTHRTLSFHRRVRDVLFTVMSHFAPSKKMNLISQAELILAIESFEDLQAPKSVVFVALCSGSGRQAHHPARANFVELVNPANQAGPMVWLYLGAFWLSIGAACVSSSSLCIALVSVYESFFS